MSPPPDMTAHASTTVGARLREAREKRGVSLRQIADRTRISVMALEALEKNDMKRLPGGIFTRAFVRSYAAEVGLDPDQTVRDFLAQFPREPVAAGRASGQIEDSQTIESDRRIAETLMRLVLLSIPIAGVVIYLGFRAPSPVAPSEVPTAVQPNVIEEPVAPASPPAEATAATSGALTMVIAPQADCWVSPTIDGRKVPSGLVSSGQRRELKAVREIVLTVGDGAACSYTLNGAAGRPFGAAGLVATRRITLENYRSYLMP